MKIELKILFMVWGCLVLLTGCSSVPGFNSVHVTSNPSGARVYNACGFMECGTAFRGFRPYDDVQGTYRGETPVSYPVRMLYAYDNVRLVWPDGEDSGWMAQSTGFWKDITFHFTKRNLVLAPATTVVGRVQSSQSAVESTSEIKLQPDISQLQQQSYPEMRRVSAGVPERPVAANAIAAPKTRFGIAAHIEDDPARGDAILGNGDGFIQKGEAFDLVVVVANISTSTVRDVACTVLLPEDKSIKAYSELQCVVSELISAAAVTNRFNLAVPLSTTISAGLACTIEVKEEGASVVDHVTYTLPTDLIVLAGAETQSVAKQSSIGGEPYEDIPAVVMPMSGVGEAASVPKTGGAPLGFVTVIGLVKNPGQISIYDARDLTLVAVVEKAGGVTALAAPSRIRISHRLADGTIQTRKVDLRSVIKNGNVTGDIPIEVGDTVMVPEVWF